MSHDAIDTYGVSAEAHKRSIKNHLTNPEEHSEHSEHDYGRRGPYTYFDLCKQMNVIADDEARKTCIFYLDVMRKYILADNWDLALKTFRTIIEFIKEHDSTYWRSGGGGFWKLENLFSYQRDPLHVPVPEQEEENNEQN